MKLAFGTFIHLCVVTSTGRHHGKMGIAVGSTSMTERQRDHQSRVFHLCTPPTALIYARVQWYLSTKR